MLAKEKQWEYHGSIKMKEIVYKSGPWKVRGLLAVPVEKKKHSAILYLRGGIKRVGRVRKEWVLELAKRDFVVFAPYYRGNEGGEGKEDFAGCDREDAIAAYDVLRARKEVDRTRIHIIGFSRGGAMALFTAQAKKDACSVVLWNGVTNMRQVYEERKDLRRMLRAVTGGTPEEVPEEYEWRSPFLYHDVDNLEPPVLIIHAEEDEHVPVSHAIKCREQLARKNHACTTWILKRRKHHLPADEVWKVTGSCLAWLRDQEV